MNAATTDGLVMAAGAASAAPTVDDGAVPADDTEGIVTATAGWLHEAQRYLDAHDHEGAVEAFHEAVASLDGLSVETAAGTTETGLATRLLTLYSALRDAYVRGLDAAVTGVPVGH